MLASAAQTQQACSMPRSIILPESARNRLATAIAEKGLPMVAASYGVAVATLARASRGLGVSPGTAARVDAIVGKVRTADEFKGSGAVAVTPPIKEQGPFAWSLETIRAARDEQQRGVFKLPVRLAEAMRTDDALYTAYHNRIAPQRAVQAVLVPCEGTRGAAVARKAARSVSAPRSVIAGINGTLANHGIAIGYVKHQPNDEGTRIDMQLTEWPLEFVRWRPSPGDLITQTREGPTITITHGDGRWIVFRKFEDRPWLQEAAVLPASMLWPGHAYGVADWASLLKSHGMAKIMGELPEGVALQQKDADGNIILSPQAAAMMQMLVDIVSGNAGAGIRPAGSKTDFIANDSTASVVFDTFVTNREKAAARIYLGTDAMLGSVGGAPGVDIAALFGVATTKIQGDFDALEQGLSTGLYQPWTAINEGDSHLAPRAEYQMPDPDAAAKSEEVAAKQTRLFDTLDRMRALNLDVTQTDVNRIAKDLGIACPPRLGLTASKQLQISGTDAARAVRVREVRDAQGLLPFGDSRDDMTLPALEIIEKGKADAAVAQAKAAATIAAQAAAAATAAQTPPSTP